jgi:hypothetical protein
LFIQGPAPVAAPLSPGEASRAESGYDTHDGPRGLFSFGSGRRTAAAR